ncbi:MAG: hypothetical protein IPM54_24965 [Polyangiaceae bacterium]|nr:hypothetical protein [Polyangiaceae bacterium]
MDNLRVVVDTREQTPLEPFVLEKGARVHLPTVRRKLEVGDYGLDGHDELVMLERKSIADFWSTITHGRDRFCAELLRAVEAHKADPSKYARRYVVIEGGWNDLDMYMITRGHGVPLSRINANVTALSIDYHVDFVWCEKYGREEAEWFVGFVLQRLWEQMNDAKAAKKAAERGLDLPWGKVPA